MAGYREHISVSGLCGTAYGTAAVILFGFTPEQGILSGILCWMSGMLPDVDSETGKPVQKIFGILAAVVPMMMMERFREVGTTQEQIILLAICTYTAIRYGFSYILGKLSVHRGMKHSIPALFIAAQTVMLVYRSDELAVKGLMGIAVAIGFLSHLLLDELYSVEFTGTRLKLNKAAGSALKFVGKNFYPNIFTYTVLMFVTYLTLVQFGVIEGPEKMPHSFRQAVESLPMRK
ncbi:MAG: metal-dependent hydrolase [Planctomycetaceae bacterium]|nr:metal-dependent hydrolase [Planctomycetaceae bacterium]